MTGDKEAFRTIVDTYKSYIYQLVLSVLRDPKDAEDTTQEVFMKIYLSLPQYQYEGFKTWIARIAIHKAIDVKRKRERERSKEELSDALERHVESRLVAVESTEDVFLLEERKDTMRRQLQQMPENYRAVVHAYYIRDQSYQEIAVDQGTALKTIESKLYRAKKWMRKHWKEEDY